MWRVELGEGTRARPIALRGEGYTVVAITRDGVTTVPDEGVEARAGDVLHVGCTPDRLGAARRALTGEGER